jgi:hypothetical protein
VVLTVVAAVIFAYQQLQLKRENETKIPEVGVRDEVFERTEALNQYFLSNKDQRNILLIVCSFMLDVSMLVGLFRWCFFGSSWQVVMAAMVFYGFRFAIQGVWFVQYPDGYNWAYPGVMSIFVPYGETADFFYSGHVGVCLLMYLSFADAQWYYWSYFALLTLFMQFFMMIALRSHYTVDMVAGIIFAHYFYLLAGKHSYIVDWYVFGMTKQATVINQRSTTLKRQDPSKKIEAGQLYYLSCDDCIHLLEQDGKNKRVVAFPILREDREC